MNQGEVNQIVDLISPLSRQERNLPPLIESLGEFSYRGTNVTPKQCYDFSMTYFQQPYFTPAELIGNCMNPSSWAISPESVNPRMKPFLNQGMCFRIANLGPTFAEDIKTILALSAKDPSPLTLFSYYMDKQAEYPNVRDFAQYIPRHAEMITSAATIGNQITSIENTARDSKTVMSMLTNIFKLNDTFSQLLSLIRLYDRLETVLPRLLQNVFDGIGETADNVIEIRDQSLDDIADILLYKPFVRIGDNTITSYEWFLVNGGIDMAFAMAVKVGITVAYMTIQEVYMMIVTMLRYMINPDVYPQYYALMQVRYLIPYYKRNDYLMRMNPEFYPIYLDNSEIFGKVFTNTTLIDEMFTTSFQEFARGVVAKSEYLNPYLDIVSSQISALEMYHSYYVPLITRLALQNDPEYPALVTEVIDAIGNEGIMSSHLTMDRLRILMNGFTDQELITRFGILRKGVPLDKYVSNQVWMTNGLYAQYAGNRDNNSESRAVINARSDEYIMNAYGVSEDELPAYRQIVTMVDNWRENGLLTRNNIFLTWMEQGTRVAYSLNIDFNPPVDNPTVMYRDDAHNQQFDIYSIDSIFQLMKTIPIPDRIPLASDPSQYIDNPALLVTKRAQFKVVKDNNVMAMASRLGEIIARVDEPTRLMINQVLCIEYWMSLLLRFWLGPGNPITNQDTNYMAYFGMRSSLIQYYNEKFNNLRNKLIVALERQRIDQPYFWDEYMMLMNRYAKNSAFSNNYLYVPRSGIFINTNSVPGNFMLINANQCMSILAGRSIEVYYSIIWNYSGDHLLTELGIDPRRPYNGIENVQINNAIRDTMASLFTDKVKTTLTDYFMEGLDNTFKYVNLDPEQLEREKLRLETVKAQLDVEQPGQEIIRNYLATKSEIENLERTQQYRILSQSRAPENMRFQADKTIKKGVKRIKTLNEKIAGLQAEVNKISRDRFDQLVARIELNNTTFSDLQLINSTPTYEEIILLYYKLLVSTLIRENKPFPDHFPGLAPSKFEQLELFTQTYQRNWNNHRNMMAIATIGSPVYFDFENPLDREGRYNLYGKNNGVRPGVNVERFYQGYLKLGYSEYSSRKEFYESAEIPSQVLSGPTARFLSDYTQVLIWISLINFRSNGYEFNLVSPNEMIHSVDHADESDNLFSEKRYAVLI